MPKRGESPATCHSVEVRKFAPLRARAGTAWDEQERPDQGHEDDDEQARADRRAPEEPVAGPTGGRAEGLAAGAGQLVGGGDAGH